VKDPLGGSSIGMGIAKDAAALGDPAGIPRRNGPRLLVEAFIPGREWQLRRRGQFPPLAPTEIRPLKGGFFTYEAKYQPAAARRSLPRNSRPKRSPASRLSPAKPRVAAAFGLPAAPDFIYAEGRPGPDNLFVLETNTLPGFTPTSLLPKPPPMRA
jgi:D-alanine-D-alanine ligase